MAGDWIKIEHSLATKPEVFGIARRVGQNRDTVVAKLIAFWVWADLHSVDGANLTLTSDDVDSLVGMAGFASAMRAEGWLAGEDYSLQLPNFERHNGSSAKARALESEAKRLRRLSDNVSDKCPTKTTPIVGPEERRGEERREEKISSRKAPIGKPLDRSTRDFLDLSEVRWPEVIQWVEAAAKRIPPKSLDDRRAWLKYGVMAWMQFSEAWLVGAADAVANASKVNNRCAAFVTALRNAAKDKHDVEQETFDGIFARIEIPKEIWKSDAIKVKGV